jgi:prepilin-type N-terminal cleavage/methylation domain-containing protein
MSKKYFRDKINRKHIISRQGFTLIELLVVLSIILVLASLLLSALGLVGRGRQELTTDNRIDRLLASLSQAGRGVGSQAGLVIDAALARHPDEERRIPFRVNNLRVVLGTLAEKYGLNFEDYSGQVGRWMSPVTNMVLPPNLASIYDSDSKIGITRANTPELISGAILSVTSEGLSYESTHSARGFGGFFSREAESGAIRWHSLISDYQDGLYHPVDCPTGLRPDKLDNIVLFESYADHGAIEWANMGTYTQPKYDSPPAFIPPVMFGAGARTYFWYHKSDAPYAASGERRIRLYRRVSPVGENLDQTFEVVPDGLRQRAWYYKFWPVMVEDVEISGSSTTIYQRCWPTRGADAWNDDALAWDQAVPDHTPLLWPCPFGKRLVMRSTGQQTTNFWRYSPTASPRSVRDFSPLLTADLLLLSGVVRKDQINDYRQDRLGTREWNDAWGNPLVIGYAAYLAPRNDFEQNHPSESTAIWQRKTNIIAASTDEFTANLQGGRDYFLRRFREIYGSERLVWLSAGAMGPYRSIQGLDNNISATISDWEGVNPLRWEASADDIVFRAAWLQIVERCRANEWVDEGFETLPWSGVRKVKVGQERCFLSAPRELK